MHVFLLIQFVYTCRPPSVLPLHLIPPGHLASLLVTASLAGIGLILSSSLGLMVSVTQTRRATASVSVLLFYFHQILQILILYVAGHFRFIR